MYRVFLIPTDEFSQKELWLDAYTAHESDCGDYWDFVGPEDRLIRRLAKIGVKAFEKLGPPPD